MVVNSTNGCRRWDRRRSALDVLEWRVASGTKLFGGKMRVVVVVGLVMVMVVVVGMIVSFCTFDPSHWRQATRSVIFHTRLLLLYF